MWSRVFAALAFLAIAVTASAQPWRRPLVNYRYPICIERVDPFRELPPPRVPVGCEIIDCCPGCPGPGPIDWEIRVRGHGIAGVSLRFQGLTSRELSALKLEGSVKRVGDTLHVGVGDAVVRGFPRGVDRPVTATYRLLPGGSRPVRAEKAPAPKPRAAADEPADGDISITINQLLGKIPVREFTSLVLWERCEYGGSGSGEAQDWIRLKALAATRRAAILVDGRRQNGCVDDEQWRAAPDVGVSNLLLPPACASEVAVFAIDNAALFAGNVNAWTNMPTDTLGMTLQPAIQVPITVWVMQGPFATTSAQVNADVARATTLLNTMQAGVTVAATINNQTNNANTNALLNANCGNANALRTQIGFTNNRLNAYYLNNPGARGWFCGNNTLIVSATLSDNESLAHEIGHAFSLGHTNAIAGMSATNLMATGGLGRDNVTTGQGFRINFNDTSALVTNGLRTAIPRFCRDTDVTQQCPALSLDVVPK